MHTNSILPCLADAKSLVPISIPSLILSLLSLQPHFIFPFLQPCFGNNLFLVAHAPYKFPISLYISTVRVEKDKSRASRSRIWRGRWEGSANVKIKFSESKNEGGRHSDLSSHKRVK